MKALTLSLGLMWALPVAAQIDIRINVPLPTVRFEAPPPLVVVEPGVQVVPEYDEEVFFVGGVYWMRRDGRWFRSRDHRGGWVVMEDRTVPPALVRIPQGRYRHWHAEARREERREERREAKREERREDREHDEGEHHKHKHDRDHDDH